MQSPDATTKPTLADVRADLKSGAIRGTENTYSAAVLDDVFFSLVATVHRFLPAFAAAKIDIHKHVVRGFRLLELRGARFGGQKTARHARKEAVLAVATHEAHLVAIKESVIRLARIARAPEALFNFRFTGSATPIDSAHALVLALKNHGHLLDCPDVLPTLLDDATTLTAGLVAASEELALAKQLAVDRTRERSAAHAALYENVLTLARLGYVANRYNKDAREAFSLATLNASKVASKHAAKAPTNAVALVPAPVVLDALPEPAAVADLAAPERVVDNDVDAYGDEHVDADDDLVDANTRGHAERSDDLAHLDDVVVTPTLGIAPLAPAGPPH